VNFINTDIQDVIICEPEIHKDDRGHFFESFRHDKLEKFLGYKIHFCQDNESYSSYGTLRGLHFQKPPFEQTKLVRVSSGEILDVAVDLRKKSKTYGKHIKIKLSAKNKKQLLIPKGFAHGFLVISQSATVCYKVDNYYSHIHDSGILFNDKILNIDWEINSKNLKLSEKDMEQMPFKG
jgi:dTDP-4-dehydrorhamnose 3,5-epimerase